MLLAVKNNREERISAEDKEIYEKAGYTLFEKDGDEVKELKAPVQKSKEVIDLQKENAELKAKLEELEAVKEEEPKKPGKAK